jgi:hypothetical protein
MKDKEVRTMGEKMKTNPAMVCTEMFSEMFKNYNGMLEKAPALQPILQLSQVYRQGFVRIFETTVDYMWKLNEVGRAGDIEKLWKTYMDSTGEIYKTYGETLKEEQAAFHQCWKSVVNVIPGSAAMSIHTLRGGRRFHE